MKVDLTQIRSSHNRHANARRQIILRAATILFILISFFFITAKLSENFGRNYLLSHFLINISPDQYAERTIFPSEKFTAILDLESPNNGNYLSVGFSDSDVYKVTFFLKDKSDFILISTIGTGESKILHMIPDSIARRGYDRIEITPMRGNWDFWMEGLTILKDPDPVDFPDHTLIDFEIKKLEVEIDEMHLTLLEEKAAAAYELGILLTEEEDYVPAIILADGKRDDAEIRLKGDWTDHLEQGKWSFRIKMDKDALWGMKKFSIHRPETRNGVSEYLIQSFYRDQGGIALRYDFVDVLINGEYIGVYALEEFFDKRLIENAYRREGPIIKVNEDYLWERRAYYDNRIEDWDFGLDPENGYMDFDVFGINQTLENPSLYGYASYGITALNKLLDREVAVEEIFAIEDFAKFFATLDIFNSCHGNIWHNFRYYLNPVTGKMEPITFDNLPKVGLCESSSKRDDPLITPFFENQDFARLYVQYVRQYLQDFDGFMEKESTNLHRIETIFLRDNVYFEDFSTHLDELHQLIGSTLDEKEFKFRLEETPDGQLVIKTDKHSYLKLQMDQVLYEGRAVEARFTGNIDRIAIIETLQPKWFDDLTQFSIVYTTLEDGQKHVVPVTYPQPAFAFYTAGHVYGSHDKAGTTAQDTVHPPFAAAIEDIASDNDITFGILTGDTVYKPSTRSYGNLKETMAATGKPYYIAPGNHDLDGSGLFTENFGNTYQSFTQENNLFIILTPQSDWELAKDQVDFLKRTLSENQEGKANIFILTHYLFWLDGSHFNWVTPNGGPYQQNNSNFWSEVLPAVRDFKGGVYFIAGDVGAFPEQPAAVYDRDGNIHFIASGMGGGTEDNYLVVQVYDDGSVDFTLMPIGLDDPKSLGKLKDR